MVSRTCLQESRVLGSNAMKISNWFQDKGHYIPNPHHALLFSGNPFRIAIDLFVKLDSPPKWVSFNDPCEEYIYLEPQTTSLNWMFFETTISYVKVWNHPIETTIYKCLFGLPGRMVDLSPNFSLVVTTGVLQSFLLGPWFLRTNEHHIDHHGSFFHLRRLVGVTRGDLVKIAPLNVSESSKKTACNKKRLLIEKN